MSKTTRRLARTMTGVFAGLMLLVPSAPLLASELNFSAERSVKSLHPYAHGDAFTLSYLGNIYEGLVRRGADLAIEPALATHWELIEPNRWRFYLRQDVRFHNGNRFDAEDVLFSAERVRGRASALRRLIPPGTWVEKVDQYTVDFVTAQPEPVLFYQWANWFIVDAQWAKTADAVNTRRLADARQDFARTHTNGTGPFRVTAQTPQGGIVAAANETWWDQRRHGLDQVTLTPISSSEDRVEALLSGKVQLAFLTRAADRRRVNHNAGTHLHVSPSLRTLFLGMDQHRGELLYSNIKGKNPFKDRRVREALSLAIDVNTLRREVMAGFSTPSALLVAPAPGINGGDNAAYPAFSRTKVDLGRARTLMREAGYGDGFGVGMDCPANHYENDAALCMAIAAMLARIGVKVALYSQPRARFFAKVLAPRMDTSLYLFGWEPRTRDAWNPLHVLLGCQDLRSGRGKFNLGRYCNPAVDSLTDAIRVETHAAKRATLIREAWTLTTQDVAAIPLHQQAVTWGVADGINLRQHTGEGLAWRHILIE